VIRNEQPVRGSSTTDASMSDGRPHTVQRDRLGVLNVAGALNREGLDLLRRRCRAELAAQVTTLVIDFTGMTDFPSALFGLLAETGASLRHRDARLQMIGLNEAIDLIAGAGGQSASASTG
jgi:anti-anti-sigma regulatory factor